MIETALLESRRCMTRDREALSRVTVVIPAFNEAASLPLVLRDLPVVQRVIVVNNGSTDATAAVAFAHGATVVHETKRGYGAACLRGLAAIDELIDAGESPPQVVVFLDADFSDHPELLPSIAQPYRRRVGQSKISGTFWGSVKAGVKILYTIAKFRLKLARRTLPQSRVGAAM